MKATFEDFLTEWPICKKYAGNGDAIAIFDLMSDEENIFGMIDVSEAGRPALLGCLEEIENYYDSLEKPIFDLTDNFTKTAVGRMVATILAPFGYRPIVQVNFSKTNRGKYFASATRYEKTETPTLRVKKTIEKV